ncbi:hypothetical protein [Roseateles sp. LYH14W]|uniref:Uncharacterized protein n=1 Tax=Pelomonas parva TaxID=3299032 RepID=A0ABW7F0R1_9BURK
MFKSPRLRFIVTLIVSVLGFVLTLDAPVGHLQEAPLTMQVPQR